MTEPCDRWALSRRQMLAGAAGALACLGVPWRALAQGTTSDRKLLVVFNPGGWDTTRVFAPEFDNAAVDMEGAAGTTTAGGLTWVDHPDRPSVGSFLSSYADRLAIVNGVLVPSVAHEASTNLLFTGSNGVQAPEWGAIAGWAARDRFALPHLAVAGPLYAGSYGAAVARTGATGQLESLLSGAAVEMSDLETSGLRAPSVSLIDRFLRQRAAALEASAGSDAALALYAEYAEAHRTTEDLKDLKYVMDFSGGDAFSQQAAVAVDALAQGISRSATVVYSPEDWDSHSENDARQSRLFEGLFSELGQLVARLDTTMAPSGAPLSDETVVIVLSEMGRTPKLNGLNGKDHWPYTSVLMWGPGVAGGRVVGSFDDGFFGRALDPATADVDDGGTKLDARAFGATLLSLLDIDPGEALPGATVFSGLGV